MQRVFLGLVLNYFMVPSAQEITKNYEENSDGTKFVQKLLTPSLLS